MGGGVNKDVLVKGAMMTFLTCVISKTEAATSSLQGKGNIEVTVELELSN